MLTDRDDVQPPRQRPGLRRFRPHRRRVPKAAFYQGASRRFSQARITWLTGREDSVYADVLADWAHGLIDEIIENAGLGLSFGKLFQGLSKGPLGGRRFDLIIDTQRIFWTSLSLKRVPHDAFISPAARFLLSLKKPAKGYRFPKTMQRQLLDMLELASGRDFPTPQTLDLNLNKDLRPEAARLLPEGPDYIGLAPGSGGPPKC